MADSDRKLDYAGLQRYHGKLQNEIDEHSSQIAQLSTSKIDKAAQETKLASMTQEVGIDSDGKLWASGVGGVVAPEYEATETYESGDIVIHDGLLYTAKQDIDTPEEWTASHWEQTMAADVFQRLYPIIVTCVTQDGVTVTGQTVTLRNGADASASVYDTAAYDGQPVTFMVQEGFEYYVSVSDNLPSHYAPTTAHGYVVGTVAVTLTYSDFSNIKTGPDIKTALNNDVDLTALVGEQITCSKGSDTLTWDVVDYDSTNKTVTLLLHDTLPTQLQFDPPQALAWFEDGLPAGDYCFKWGSTLCYFTLTQDIPANGQLRATNSVFTTYESYDSLLTVETGTVSTTEIAGATNLGTTASDTGAYPLNHHDRVSYGSNNYKECGLRQWLNSDAMPNTQMPQINKLSRPYRVGQAGFLKDLDPDFIAVLDDTVWRCSANNTYEAPASVGGTVIKSTPYTVTDKIGLASEMEIFGSYGGTDDGSTEFDLFVDATADDRKKYYNGSARYWWLRSPSWIHAHHERDVSTSGVAYNHAASGSNGVVPACKISKSST